ncbi:MAG TPA: M1 family metallopeptidase [Acidimicrobiales bacterium]|nr:M1 family metallopeptidase [Acidimicrobiales bacterium]
MPQAPDYRLPLVAQPERYEMELSIDIEHSEFSGRETITLNVVEATEVLVLNSVELSIGEATLVTPAGESLEPQVTLDEETQRVRLTFDRRLTPAEGYGLTLVFSGSLNEQLRGLYRSTFTDSDGRLHTIAVTQFEAADARRAFPCWDEPEFKAVFSVALVVPEGMTALSNGAEIGFEPLGDGRKRVRFADTMRMSTYLVAFVVGPFELTEPVEVDGIPLRVASIPGKGRLARFAVDAGTHALQFLSRYFEIPYPAEKIDHIAIPDFTFGAMENLGCVTYRENSLLVDPGRASQLELQRVASVVAHETAHMWFGDLVTMKWWNGIWLNEAFATFMENLTADDFNPAWQVWNGFAAARSTALGTDGLRSTRPVEFDVGAPAEADAMFDGLTYEKGGAVLRMLEQYLGAETFRKGISHYLRTHAYANTETSDLWDALETTSGEPVRTIMNSWIRQGGHPIVSVEEVPDPSSLRLLQRRFLYDGTESPETWVVPIGLRASVNGSVQKQRLLLDGREEIVSFDGPLDWVVVNEEASGFYRTLYSQQLLNRLTDRDLIELCSPRERFELLNDTWAAVVAGLEELPGWVSLAKAVAPDDDPDVWGGLSSVVALLNSMSEGTDREALRAFASELATPLWERLGWGSPQGEGRRLATTRSRVLSLLGLVGEDPAVRAEVTARVERLLAEVSAGPADDPVDGLGPDIAATALRIYVAAGGEREWAMVTDQYLRNDNPQEKLRFLYALTEARQPELIGRTLDLAASTEVRSQDAPLFIAMVLAQRVATPIAWQWIVDNWALIVKRTPPALILRIFDALRSVSNADVAAGVEEFCRSVTLPVRGPRLDQILERLGINVTLAERLRGQIAPALQG